MPRDPRGDPLPQVDRVEYTRTVAMASPDKFLRFATLCLLYFVQGAPYGFQVRRRCVFKKPRPQCTTYPLFISVCLSPPSSARIRPIVLRHRRHEAPLSALGLQATVRPLHRDYANQEVHHRLQKGTPYLSGGIFVGSVKIPHKSLLLF